MIGYSTTALGLLVWNAFAFEIWSWSSQHLFFPASSAQCEHGFLNWRKNSDFLCLQLLKYVFVFGMSLPKNDVYEKQQTIKNWKWLKIPQNCNFDSNFSFFSRFISSRVHQKNWAMLKHWWIFTFLAKMMRPTQLIFT